MVLEVFISKKLNWNRERFGFVHFEGVKDINELEHKLNGIRIKNAKLHINHPKALFGWESGFERID